MSHLDSMLLSWRRSGAAAAHGGSDPRILADVADKEIEEVILKESIG